MRLSPPKKSVFWAAVAIAVIGFIVYVLKLAGLTPSGTSWMIHILFWLPTASFVLLALGNALTGF